MSGVVKTVDRRSVTSRSAVPAREWRALCGQFRDSLEQLSDVAGRRLTGLASLHPGGRSSLPDVCRTGLALLVEPVEERRTPRHTESYARASTDALKEQGAQIGDVLQAWHHLSDVLRGWAREVAATYGDGAEVAFLDVVVPYVTVGMAVSASRYTLDTAVPSVESRLSSFVHGALTGRLTDHELRAGCHTHGLDPGARYLVVRACTSNEAEARSLCDWLAFRAGRRGAVAVVEGGVWGLLPELPPLPGAHLVGVSRPVGLAALPAGFRQASRAMLTAGVLGWSGAQSLPSLGVFPALLDDEEVGAGLLERYVVPFLAEGASGIDVLRTVRTHLANDCHAPSTAQALVVHPNTVRYRVRQFESTTGARLGSTATLVEVWWALEAWGLRTGQR